MRWFALLLLVLAPQDKPTWEQIVERGKKNVERLRGLRDGLPRAEFDPKALAKELGGDLEKSTSFVRDAIGHESYRGFLKGAQGTLVSRRGNAADRALLLAALLDGKEPKLVRGSLPPEKQPAPSVVPPAARPLDVAGVAARLQVDPERLKKKAEARELLAGEAAKQLQDRAARDREAVAAALDAAKIPLPPAPEPDGETWWVRVGDRDLLKPEGAVEEEVHAEPPPAAFHRIVLRMIIKAGGEEAPVLDVGYRAADLFGRTLTIQNVPGDDPGRLPRLKSKAQKAQLDALAATTLFVPLLTGGKEPITGHPFDLDGVRRPVTNGVIQKLEGVLKLFDDLPGEKKTLEACWLELETHAPGAEPRRVRRTIFAGKAGRQKVLDLLQTRDLLIAPGSLSGDFVLDRVLEADVASKDLLLSRLKKPSLVPEALPSRTPSALWAFAARRSTGGLSATAPLVVSHVRRILDGARVKVRGGIDILSNGVAGAPGTSWKDNPALAAGILDTALEHEVHKGVPGEHANASVALEKSKAPLKAEVVDGRPRVKVAGGWYDVDPATGSCLGMMAEGGGQDMTEYATLLVNKIEEIREWQAYGERLEAALDCVMSALDSDDPERTFALCMASAAIGEAFGWAAGGILGGAAGDSPWARLGAMAAEDWMNDTLGDATDAATGH